MRNRFLLFMVALASVNWWIFLWTWTWMDRRPDDNVVAANALTSLIVFSISLGVWAFFKSCEIEEAWKTRVLDRSLNEMLDASRKRIKK